MAIAYKWKIDNNTTAYISDENGGLPFIYSNLSGNTRQKVTQQHPEACAGMPSDKAIEIATNNITEEAYSTRFRLLQNLLEQHYGYELLDGDNYNTGVYYWPENDYNKTALDVNPDFKIVDAEEPPSLTASLYGTDSTKKIKLDIEFPAGYDGFSCYLSPDSLSFVREDIINERGTTSATTEVMLFRGTTKIEPYSIEIEQSEEDDEITLNGSVITIKPHITVIPPNLTKAVYDLRGVTDSDDNYTTTKGPQTTTTTAAPIDTTTTTRTRKKNEISDRKIWVYVTYRWREYGSNEFMYFNTKLLLRYNILTYDLIEASKNGDINTDNYDAKDGFEKWVRDLSGKTETFYKINASEFAVGARNRENKASSSIIVTASGININLTNEISGTSYNLWARAGELDEEFVNALTNNKNRVRTGSSGRLRTITDDLNKEKGTFENNAANNVRTYNSEVTGAVAQVRESLGGIVQIMSGYSSGLTSLYTLLDSGVAAFVEDDIKGYASAFVFDAEKMLMAVSSVTGSYSGVKATADQVSSVAKSATAAASLIQGADEVCLEAEGEIRNLYNEVEHQKSQIVQRSGEIRISSNEIKLEGETTFNDGFTILKDGTAIIKNGYLHGYSQCVVKDITNERLFANCDTDITYSYMNNDSLSAITVSGFTISDFTGRTGGIDDVVRHFGDRIYEIPMCLELAKYGEVDGTKQTPLYLDEYHTIYAGENTKYSVYTINKKTPTSLLLDAKKLKIETDDSVQIYLPIDPEYVGTTIKIIVNNIGAEHNIFPEITVGYTNNYGVYWPKNDTDDRTVWAHDDFGVIVCTDIKATPFALLASANGGVDSALSNELLQLGPIRDEDEMPYNTLKLGNLAGFTGSIELTAVPSAAEYVGKKNLFLPNGLPSRCPSVNGENISFGALDVSINKTDKLVQNYTALSSEVKNLRLAKWIVNKIDVIEGDFEYEQIKRATVHNA